MVKAFAAAPLTAPLTFSGVVTELFAQVCDAPSDTLVETVICAFVLSVRPPVPSVSVFVPPIATGFVAVREKLTLFTLKSMLPSTVLKFVASGIVKMTSSEAPGSVSVPELVPPRDDQFVPFAPAVAFQNVLLSPVQKNGLAMSAVGTLNTTAPAAAIWHASDLGEREPWEE